MHIKTLTQSSVSMLANDLGLNHATYYNWCQRRKSGCLTDQSPVGRNPNQLLGWEREVIIDYFQEQREHYTGYKRLTYEMIDKDVVYTSPSSVYRVLSNAGLLVRWAPAKKLGSVPPLPEAPNKKWHTDLMQINHQGDIFYYQGVIDANSRYLIAHDVHIDGTALNAGMVLQAAFDQSPPGITPIIVADNGPEFIGKEFRAVIRENNGQRMRISAYHPQSNGIDERHHRTLREECLNKNSHANLIEIRQMIDKWVDYYNNERLHSALWYMPPVIWHYGDPEKLRKERNNKLKKAREERRNINLKPMNRVVS